MDDDIQINTTVYSRPAKTAVKKPAENGKRKFNETTGRNDDGKRFKSDYGKSAPSATAKFSSIFKNNAEIPVIKNSSADHSLSENLFSANTFSSLNLHPHLTDCIEKRFKLDKMTQVQEKTIPVILNGSDCFVKSMTGSGKTLAYAVPIVQLLQAKDPPVKRNDGIFALVLVPTRELAQQTCTVFEQLCQSCVRVVAGALIGGIKKKAEKNRIRKGLNILIATPGRLCDHLDTTMALDLAKVEYLIFDEADRMLDMDFEKKINFIIFKLNEKRKELDKPKPQIILTSATLTSGVHEIARRLNIVNSVTIDVASNGAEHPTDHQQQQSAEEEQISLPAGLKNYFMIVPSKLRLIGLMSFILNKFIYSRTKNSVNKMIIFASTNDTVEFHEILLRIFLNHKFSLYFDDEDISMPRSSHISKDDKIEVFKLYGNLNQHDRTETLSKFRKAETGVLLCTDVLARGLDLPNIDWVIQYNTPGTCVDYVHRVGRTARVGQIGNALIFLEPCEVEYINELNKLGISLKELKIDAIMECLIEEANHYPKQVNSDNLVIARNAEECANSMQFYIEEYVDKHTEVESLARRAYLSFLRSYSTYSKDWKRIFHVKNLHLGHAAKSFGLREAPKEIVAKLSFNSNSSYSHSDNNNNHHRNGSSSSNGGDGEKRSYNFNSETRKPMAKPFDQSGYAALLRRHKTVDEHGAGFDTSQKLPKNIKTVTMANKKPTGAKLSLADRIKKASTTNPKSKTVKRDMSVFD